MDSSEIENRSKPNNTQPNRLKDNSKTNQTTEFYPRQVTHPKYFQATVGKIRRKSTNQKVASSAHKWMNELRCRQQQVAIMTVVGKIGQKAAVTPPPHPWFSPLPKAIGDQQRKTLLTSNQIIHDFCLVFVWPTFR